MCAEPENRLPFCFPAKVEHLAGMLFSSRNQAVWSSYPRSLLCYADTMSSQTKQIVSHHLTTCQVMNCEAILRHVCVLRGSFKPDSKRGGADVRWLR